MTRTIHKYPFVEQYLNAPHGPVRLVAQQNDAEFPTLWIEHPVGAPATATFEIRPTGAEFEFSAEHVGSAVCGPFVWHVYRLATT